MSHSLGYQASKGEFEYVLSQSQSRILDLEAAGYMSFEVDYSAPFMFYDQTRPYSALCCRLTDIALHRVDNLPNWVVWVANALDSEVKL